MKGFDVHLSYIYSKLFIDVKTIFHSMIVPKK